MGAVKEIVDFACGDLGLSDQETRDKVMVAVQRAWYKVAAAHHWQFLRRSTTLTGNDTDTQGALLPSDMVNIIDPIKDTSDNLYFGISQNGTPPHNNHYWYFLDDTHVAPLKEGGTKLTILQGATTFTYSEWDDDYIDEYVKFGKEPGIYLLSAARTISDFYHGPRISGGAIQIRPRGTLRLSLCDSTKERMDATVSLHYWVYPPPLYHEWQPIPQHLVEPLQWATVAEVKGHTIDKKRGLAIRDYGPQFDSALNMAIVKDPSPRIRETQRDNRGKRMTLGRRG